MNALAALRSMGRFLLYGRRVWVNLEWSIFGADGWFPAIGLLPLLLPLRVWLLLAFFMTIMLNQAPQSSWELSDDPRLRKSAWAVVAVRIDGDEFVVIGTMSGALADSDETCNTVPRAELMALVRALEALSWHDGPVQVAFDASYVQTTWQKVSHNMHVGNPNGDLKMRLRRLDRRSVELC